MKHKTVYKKAAKLLVEVDYIYYSCTAISHVTQEPVKNRFSEAFCNLYGVTKGDQYSGGRSPFTFGYDPDSRNHRVIALLFAAEVLK